MDTRRGYAYYYALKLYYLHQLSLSLLSVKFCKHTEEEEEEVTQTKDEVKVLEVLKSTTKTKFDETYFILLLIDLVEVLEVLKSTAKTKFDETYFFIFLLLLTMNKGLIKSIFLKKALRVQ